MLTSFSTAMKESTPKALPLWSLVACPWVRGDCGAGKVWDIKGPSGPKEED